MVKQVLSLAVCGAMVLGAAVGESVSAVPKLEMDRYMGAWYEVARLPNKKEKHCIGDGRVLYSVGDKARRFQMVTSCRIAADNSDAWNAVVKMNKSGDGRLTVTYVWPFSAKYWVLAVGPAYEWALVGSPNHKTLWVLSRTTTLKPEVLAEIEAKAVAEGFDVGKLVMVPQRR